MNVKTVLWVFPQIFSEDDSQSYSPLKAKSSVFNIIFPTLIMIRNSSINGSVCNHHGICVWAGKTMEVLRMSAEHETQQGFKGAYYGSFTHSLLQPRLMEYKKFQRGL